LWLGSGHSAGAEDKTEPEKIKMYCQVSKSLLPAFSNPMPFLLGAYICIPFRTQRIKTKKNIVFIYVLE
jgi:hypothetical protein